MRKAKKIFYCPTCKKQVTDVYLDSLTGISKSQFSKKCSICDTPVLEFSGKEIKVKKPLIEKPKETVGKKIDKRKGICYGAISIVVAVVGFFIPIPINAFAGMVSIILGRQAIISGSSRIGKIGAILGFINFIFLLLMSINLIR